MTKPFDPKSYWESRLGGRFDLRGVGDIGLSEAYNKYMYRVRRHAFHLILKRLKLQRNHFDALDVGSGTGFYIDQWLRHGPNQLIGSDLTTASVGRLTERFPGAHFQQCDIGAELPEYLANRQFDVVSAMDMLFHIVDDTAYAQAYANFAKLVRPGGWLIFSENLLPARRSNGPHQTSRAEVDVRNLLNENHFNMLFTQPMFVLMNDPVRSKSRVLHKLFSIIYSCAGRGEMSGSVVGAALYPLELLAIRALSRGPSTEIFLCQRTA
jgi:SAM-dependent methyltransferase